MGESNSRNAELLARRRRHAWGFSLAAALPFLVFLAVLTTAPISLGWRPFGGAISIAIYLAVLLYAWPVVIGAAYIITADREAP